jgi:RNA recognition motif-containing protein
MRGYNGTVPTGSAIVQFYSAASATAAIQDLNGTELDGRRLYVRAYFT